ncbi:MAG TPA: lipid II flippase MurJ, partial [Bryobacteraceae bacterium]|nr:lipid II flippase MurJ [Bryobacteraceae bacterium]
KVVNPAFYALDDARTPMIVSLVSIIVNYSMATTLIRVFDLRHYGLALSTSTVAIVSAVILFWVMRNRAGGIYGRNLGTSTVRIIVASFAMGLAVWTASSLVARFLGSGKLGFLVDLAVSIPVGLVVYYGVCRALRVPELEIAVQALAGPLKRRFGRG